MSELLHHMITINGDPHQIEAIRSDTTTNLNTVALNEGDAPLVQWDNSGGDTVKITFSTAAIPYSNIIAFAQRYGLRFIYRYAHKDGSEWGVEVWREGQRVEHENRNEMVRRQVWIELFDLDLYPAAEWRPVPPSGYIKANTKGTALKQCPECNFDDAFIFYSQGSHSFQDPLARDMHRQMLKADEAWLKSLQQATKEHGFTFDQFYQSYGNRPDINDGRFSVNGVLLTDAWSRTGRGACTHCWASIWHDFIKDDWRYYYHPQEPPAENEGDSPNGDPK